MDKIREHENLRGCAEGMLIRTEEPGDFDIVRELVRLSFKDMEESDHTEHLLVDRIRRSDAYIPALSLVAPLFKKAKRCKSLNFKEVRGFSFSKNRQN